jgi:uncharacterized protein (TIGR03435 family)
MQRVVVVACVSVILSLASHPVAQSSGGPAFEVVSVKPSNPDAAGPTLLRVGGQFTASNATLRRLVGIAYDISESRIEGGPGWQTSRRFDIQAKAADPVAGLPAMQPMLKTLLADRFQLKVHAESRERPIYALVVAREDGRLGPDITRSTADCSTVEQDLADASARDRDTVARRLASGQGVPCAIMPGPTRAAGSMTMRGNAASMALLAEFLSAFTGRTVRDRTGLSGVYDWEITFDRSRTPAAGTPRASDSPSVMTALQEQLGLKLESARGDVEFLVIDGAALPSAD